MGSHETYRSIAMADDPRAWMKKLWSIRVVISRGGGDSIYTCYSTAQPFEASPDEAQQALDDLRSKIMSICVSNTSPAPLVVHERQPGGELLGPVARYWAHERSHVAKAIGNARVFYPVVDQCIIPANVLRDNIVRLTLVDEVFA